MRLLKVRQSTKKAEGGIMFPTTHDLHYKHRDWWFPFLKEMLENGNDVLIVTKPEYAAVSYICEKLEQYKNQMEFRFTIGTNDDKVAEYWEPGAPRPSDRLIAIAHVSTLGFRTSISMEPLLIEQPKEMIDNLFMGWITGTIWIGIMNHYDLNPAIPEESRQIKIQGRENMQRVYYSLKDNPQIRWKDSVQKFLGVAQL
jgi:DNA repair photolyase